jgi:hypothetical protein
MADKPDSPGATDAQPRVVRSFHGVRYWECLAIDVGQSLSGRDVVATGWNRGIRSRHARIVELAQGIKVNSCPFLSCRGGLLSIILLSSDHDVPPEKHEHHPPAGHARANTALPLV